MSLAFPDDEAPARENFKQFIAFIMQQADNPPTIEAIKKNTLGGVPVFSYIETGAFDLTLEGAFPGGNRTEVFITGQNGSQVIFCQRNGDDAISIFNSILVQDVASGVTTQESDDMFFFIPGVIHITVWDD